MKNGFFKTVLHTTFVVGLATGCAALDRSPGSGYNARASSPKVVHQSSSTTGLESRRIETKTRLKQLENSIQSKKEMEQYSTALPYLKDEDERILFLQLPGFEARQKWLKEEGLNDRTRAASENYRDLVEAQDIGVGMTQSLVKKSWGDPDSVEVSGNPQFRNERWHYNRYVSTQDGYKMEKKVVYFEAGRVVGWEAN